MTAERILTTVVTRKTESVDKWASFMLAFKNSHLKEEELKNPIRAVLSKRKYFIEFVFFYFSFIFFYFFFFIEKIMNPF